MNLKSFPLVPLALAAGVGATARPLASLIPAAVPKPMALGGAGIAIAILFQKKPWALPVAFGLVAIASAMQTKGVTMSAPIVDHEALERIRSGQGRSIPGLNRPLSRPLNRPLNGAMMTQGDSRNPSWA